MARPVKRLTNMEIDEISIVDKGANQHAMITIAKRAPEEELMPELYNEDGELLDESSLEDGQIVFDEEGNAYQFTADGEEEFEDESELMEVGKAAQFRFAQGVSNNGRFGSSAKEAASAFSAGDKHAHTRMKISGAADKVFGNGRQARNRKLGLAGVGVAGAGGAGYEGKKHFGKSFSEEIMEELSKAYSDSDRDAVLSKAFSRVEELENRYQAAEEIAKSERDLRLTREYISKAAEYNLPVDPHQLGPVLYRMAESMSYDDCAVIAKALETAGSIIFEEQGYIGGGDNTDIMSQVEARAVEIGKAADPVTISGVFDQAPEAYDEYLASRRGY